MFIYGYVNIHIHIRRAMFRVRLPCTDIENGRIHTLTEYEYIYMYI